MNNSRSNIVQPLLWVERYHQHIQAVLAATGMNGLTKVVLTRFRLLLLVKCSKFNWTKAVPLVFMCFNLFSIFLYSGAVFICTEDAFPNKRLHQMMQAFKLKHADKAFHQSSLGDNIFIEHAAEMVG